MTVDQIIETYLRGWELGDGVLSQSVTVDDFYYDDPQSRRIFKDEFVQFVEDFKSAAIEMGGELDANPFLQYSDVVIDKSTSPVTVWCWWQAVGTELQGAALVKVDERGVLREKIAYS
jgi:hypothetical protein